MINFLPNPYPDELLYSVFSRYHTYSPNIRSSVSVQDLFGEGFTPIGCLWQVNLANLLARLPANSKLTSEFIFNNLSLLPIIKPFQTEEKIKTIKSTMLDNECENTKVSASFGFHSKKVHLNFCPTCFKYDRDKYGEAYWHRVHQIKGVFLCPTHGDVLKRFSPKIKNRTYVLRHLNLIEEKDFEDFQFDLSDDEVVMLKKIALELEYIFKKDMNPMPNHYFANKYRNLLYNKGISTLSGFTHKEILKKEFNTFFGMDLLQLLNCEVNQYWFDAIRQLDNPRTFSPIHHVIMMIFLCGSAEKFYEYTIPRSVFGDGPWLCLNAVCKHFKERCIEDIETNQAFNATKSIGIFCCPYCKFTYSRIKGATDNNDEFKINRYVDFGPIWDNKLIELVNKKDTLTFISETLGVHRKKVKEQIAKLVLKVEPKPNKLIIEREEKRKNNRKKWLIQRENNRNLARDGLLELNPTLTRWMIRNDNEWLYEHLPALEPQKSMRKIIDWEKRDEEIYQDVKLLIENWNDYEKPLKITKTKIAKKLNLKKVIFEHSEMIPKTMHFIEESAESTQQFTLRKVKWAIDFMINNGIVPSRELVGKHANIYSENLSEEQKNEIFNLIDEAKRKF
jgi:hypothetical protein